MALQRVLGVWQLRVYGVGTIVGAGIYSVIGVAAGEAGPALWWSFLFAGAGALLAAMSYAELASMEPRTGAEYRYLKLAWPDSRLLPFLAGFLIALNAAATAATVALAFGGYLRSFIPALPAPLTAFVLLTACTALNIIGIRQSTRVGIALICIEVAGLVLIAIAGLAMGDVERIELAWPSAGVGGAFAASALLFFMFIGFEDVANLSEEAQRPRQDIPRALIDAVVATTALYLVVCFGVLAAIGTGDLARSDSPLTAAGNELAPWIGTTLTVTALFATASTALITLISISRLLYGMAQGGDLPAPLKQLLPRRNTPWIAALVLYAGACALLPLGRVELTASVSALGILTVFAAIHIAVIRLRRSKPDRKRGFRAWGGIGGWPVHALVGIAICAAFITQFEPAAYAIFAGVLGGALVLWFVRRKRRSG